MTNGVHLYMLQLPVINTSVEMMLTFSRLWWSFVVVILHQNLPRAILLSVIPTQHGLLSRSFPTLGSVVSLHLALFPDPRDGKPGNEACLRHTLHMIGVRNLNLLNGSRTSNQKTSVTVTLHVREGYTRGRLCLSYM